MITGYEIDSGHHQDIVVKLGDDGALWIKQDADTVLLDHASVPSLVEALGLLAAAAISHSKEKA